MPIAITPATLGDAAALADISAIAFPLGCPPGTAAANLHAYIGAELNPERFRQHLADPSRLLLVARASGSVVGFLMLSQSVAPAEVDGIHPIELQRLYVLPPFHGTGTAGALVNRALAIAQAMQRDTIWLSVSQQNPCGLAFYAKQGFHQVGQQQFPVGQDLHDDFIYARPVVAVPALSH
ncbi:GNAT family N-acetyltransferase [Neisseriaceae bacterium JH1-16]|nr:GNAT family N-acetyltransferase [Neisseriaceae bacterium JH1-16]